MLSSFMRARVLVLCGLLTLTLFAGCATTANNPRDPLEPLNRGIHHFNDVVDNLVMTPVATIYRGVLPSFMRTGVSNFFANINDVIIALNNLLQGKLTQAASDVGRIVVNTTVGLLGTIDVATEIGLEKHNEDFGQTLGYWGIGDGPYLVLPFVGPSSFRDGIGWLADYYTDPITYVSNMRTRNILWGTRFVNRRSELLDTTDIVKTAALDPYEFIRDAYLQRRRNLVFDGNPPADKDDIDIKVKPKSEAPRPGTFGYEPGTVLTSRDLTPAQREAREREAARSHALEPRVEAAPGSTDVARLWVPVAR
jgi:phospholipid-binding lipoprotein MlaA